MRLVYMGTPQFAVPALQALRDAGHDIAAVVTRTDKPAGRGKVLTPPPVKTAAIGMGIPVHQPRRVREPECIGTLRSIAPEAIVVAAYGQILPREILTLPKLGCINIHASLLPAGRGAAPINWSIINGDKEAGITIMQMDEGMDTGAILLQGAIPIDPSDTGGSLTEKMSLLGAELIVKALPLIASGALKPLPQDHDRATLAPLLKKEDGQIDWSLPAIEIHNRVRGLSPWPGAYGFVEGRMIKILSSGIAEGTAEPGMLAEQDKDSLVVGTGKGLLRIVMLQPEGKKPMTAAEFLRGQRSIVGKRFERKT
ncbi:MAG: methionyl-tRNA formyltransferase [Nitrospirota bacterium]|nr:methionyl-tRNA formyltransferase [Nitrospirota bacterium]